MLRTVPRGTITADVSSVDTPDGTWTGRDLTVSVPGVTATDTCTIAHKAPTVTEIGTVVYIDGGHNTDYWHGTGAPSAAEDTHFNDVRAVGYRVCEIKWSTGGGWNRAPADNRIGIKRIAARLDAVLRWLHDPANGVTITSGTFIVTGNSAGGGGLTAVLAWLDAGTYIDAAIPSNPVLGDTYRGCHDTAPGGGGAYPYAASEEELIDRAWGFAAGAGPCSLEDTTASGMWIENSVTLTPKRRLYPTTRIEMVQGDGDTSTAQPQSDAWYTSLPATVAAGSRPYAVGTKIKSTAAGTGHGITGTQNGLDAIKTAIHNGLSAGGAITATHLATAGDTTNRAAGNNYATASITPTANRLVLVGVVLSHASEVPNTPTLSGNGLTWVLEDSQAFFTVGTPLKKLFVFRAMGASPTAGAISISWATQTMTGAAWTVFELAGVDTTGANGAGAILESVPGASDSADPFSITLTVSGAATVGVFATNQTSNITPGTGFTELGEANHSAPTTAIFSEFQAAADLTVDVDFTAAIACAGVAIAVKAA